MAAPGGDKVLPSRLRRRARDYRAAKAQIGWADAAARRTELAALVAMARELLAATAADPDCAKAAELPEGGGRA